MDVRVVPTNEIYRRIIAAPDGERRRALYIEELVEPWSQMMSMARMRHDENAGDDPLAGARGWNWLLPEQLASPPAALVALEAADAWEVAADALAKAATRFEPYAGRLPIAQVEAWLVLADPERADPIMRGYTGGVDWFKPRLLGQFDTPNESNLPRLPGLVVHELHHLIRLRLFPWGPATTVADYIVHEGLAEAFAASLFGDKAITFFAGEATGAELATARQIVGEGLQKTGFDTLRAYIFGSGWAQKLGLPDVGMPTYGGYAIGYRVVQAFLERTGTPVEEATFLPAAEIVERSAYFGK